MVVDTTMPDSIITEAFHKCLATKKLRDLAAVTFEFSFTKKQPFRAFVHCFGVPHAQIGVSRTRTQKEFLSLFL